MLTSSKFAVPASISASKVAGHSALSVERVPVDPCVRVHLQSD